MKVLTVFSSLLLPLNFVASFYGMNFEHIPGLHSATAFATVVLVMVLMSIGSIWFFIYKGWFKTHRY
jgi:magnesium transporter